MVLCRISVGQVVACSLSILPVISSSKTTVVSCLKMRFDPGVYFAGSVAQSVRARK